MQLKAPAGQVGQAPSKTFAHVMVHMATASGDPILPSIPSDLSGALRSRHELTGSAADVEAVALAQEALGLAQIGNPHRAALQINLHSALLRRFERSADRHDLLDAGDAAVLDVPPGWRRGRARYALHPCPWTVGPRALR